MPAQARPQPAAKSSAGEVQVNLCFEGHWIRWNLRSETLPATWKEVQDRRLQDSCTRLAKLVLETMRLFVCISLYIYNLYMYIYAYAYTHLCVSDVKLMLSVGYPSEAFTKVPAKKPHIRLLAVGPAQATNPRLWVCLDSEGAVLDSEPTHNSCTGFAN